MSIPTTWGQRREMAILESEINKASQMNEMAHLWKPFREEMISLSVSCHVRGLLHSQPGREGASSPPKK